MASPRAIALVLAAFVLVARAAPLHASLRRGEQPTAFPGTMFDFFFADASAKPLDADNSDYDLLTLLFTYAGEEDLLKSTGTANNGFTLFAPTDEALTQTARDIREVVGLASTTIPTVEDVAWTVFQAWFDTLDDPKATMSRILKYHIVVDREFTLTDLQELPDPRLNTSSGEFILLTGTKLDIGDDRFVNPELIMDCHFTMDNGVMHPVDRMLFPNPNGQPTDTEFVKPINEISPSATPPIPTEQSAGGGGTDTAQDPSASPTPNPSAASSSEQSGEPACFPASAVVHLADGSTLPVAQLAAGHVVLSHTKGEHSPVYLFSHREHGGVHEFVTITSQHGHEITLTAGHYLYANARKTAAGSVKLGDKLQTVDGESVVTSITTVREKGLFAPHTLQGDIVVNGVLASSYTTTVSPRLAHMLLWPLRMLVCAGFAVEPLGGLLYHGSPRLAAFIPSGYDVY